MLTEHNRRRDKKNIQNKNKKTDLKSAYFLI